MQPKTENQDTRYVIDLDTTTGKILQWRHDHKDRLAQQLPDPMHHRIFVTKGQYHKFSAKMRAIGRTTT